MNASIHPWPAWLVIAPDSVMAATLRQGKSPAFHFVHLLWSVWVFVTPLFSDGYDWRWAGLTALSFPLFLLLYVGVLISPRRAAWRCVLGMIALSMVLLPVYPSGLAYFVFGCVMLRVCSRTSLTVYLGQVLTANAVFLIEAGIIGYPWQALAWIVATTLVIGIIMSVERSANDKDVALKLSHEEVRKLAATAERERIGRDLHDLLGHTLSLITLKLELARKLFDRDPAASRCELEEAEQVARQALAEVRSAVTGIRLTSLAAELASARLMLESSQVHLEYSPPSLPLPADMECALSLVLREAVTNIARHAHATRACIEFAHDGDYVQLRISDDGRGGVVDETGHGIGGMRNRVHALGGTLRIESSRRRGTLVSIQAPLTHLHPHADSGSALPDTQDPVALAQAPAAMWPG